MEERAKDIAALVSRVPDADQPEKPSKLTGPSWEAMAKLCEELLAAGRDGLLALVGMLRDPAEQGPRDFKAGYLLHALAIHVGAPGREEQRRLVAETLASQLGPEAPPKPSRAVQGLLTRELQVAGGKEVVDALGRALLDDDLCESAAQALLAIREGAAPHLRSAFARAKGAARVTLAQALGVARDAGSAAALKDAALDGDRGLRVAAAWALANIGDPGAADVLKKAALAEDGWERIQATKACLLLAERLGAAGKRAEAEALYTHLREARKDPADAYVREAAERGLAGLAKRA